MKRRTVILLTAALAAFQFALADWQTSMRGGIVPPSPTSAVYTRHGAGPPDHATGAMRLDIPVHTVRAYGYELPVTLSYSGGGIRVNDDPYPCGYGWVLQPGLRITRTVMGRPDEEVPAERFAASAPESYDHVFFRSCVNDGTELYGIRTDTERDIFSLSLPGGVRYHYVKDHQGNVRCVVREDGTTVESNEYYPYGGLFCATPSVQPYKYDAKELDRMHGLDLYDSSARWYDPVLGRTTTMDPLAKKYPGLSPYSWCAANPLRYIDERGDSIAVLHLKGSIGHLALLIQNADGKWAYFSMNGTSIYNSCNGISGGKSYNDLGRQTFDSPEAFLNSPYNREGTKEEIKEDKVNNYGYEEAYVLTTTPAQDSKIRGKFKSEAKKPYNLINNQCAQVVQKALNAGGVETTKTININIGSFNIKFEVTPIRPATTYNIIRKNYPKKLSKINMSQIWEM